MRKIRIRQSQLEAPWQLAIGRFDGGTATLLDDARTGKKYAKESINVMQVQDGVWATRWGTREYTAEASAESAWLGVTEVVVNSDTRKLFAIGATTGKAYVYDGSAWSEVSGATFDASAKPSFLQIKSHLYITNGVDPMTRYDIASNTLVRYTAISTPSGVSATRGAGLSAGSNNNYYRVTALNDVGETAGSTEVVITTDKLRYEWDPSANEYVDLTWTAVSGATRYQVYYGTESGGELLLGESTTNSYRDDNSATVNPFVACPDADTTGAPKFSILGLSDNRLWGVGDPDNPYRVYWSGVGQYLGYFSAYYGGGWIDLEEGGREMPQWVGHYRTGRGDSSATILCSTPEGTGAVWQIGLYAQTVGSETFMSPVASKIVGAIGTSSPHSVVHAMDSIVFLNKRGVFTLGNKAQITNVLATEELSANIRPSYRSLKLSKIANFTAYWYDAKIFFSATESGNENDIIFIFDTERRNWTWKWTIGVKQFVEHTDSDGVTHFLAAPHTGTKLIEFSENVTDDLGQPFYQSIITGLLPVTRDTTEFVRVLEAFVSLARPRGTIKFEIIGVEKRKGFTTVASREITTSTTGGRFWTGLLGEITLKDEEDAPVTYDSANVKKSKRVRKLLNAIQFKLSANVADTKFTLLEFRAKGARVPTATVSAWRK